MTRVAIQGEQGSYSHRAASQFLAEEPLEIVEHHSFEEAYAAVGVGRADVLVAPVENSLAGAVTRSLDLLPGCGLYAVAETRVKIELALVGRPGATLESIRCVASHPVALEQCRRFFADRPRLETRSVHDTAGSIRQLMEGTGEHDAAIGPALAARLHGAEVLEPNLEDDPHNYTRFLELRTERSEGGRRAAVSVTAENRPGGLLGLLHPIAEAGVDLTQLVTRPVPGHPWQYRFHLELRAERTADLEAALGGLEASAIDYRLLGMYDIVPESSSSGTGRRSLEAGNPPASSH